MDEHNTIEVKYEDDIESETFIITDKNIDKAISKDSELVVKCNNAKRVIL